MPAIVSPSEVRTLADRITGHIRTSTIVLGLGIILLQISLIAVIVIVWTGTKNLNDNNTVRSEITRGQIACFNIVNGNYVTRLGALAETSNRQMLGEPPNPEDTRKAVDDLRTADMLLRRVEQLCYTANPDKTPLDGDPNK